MRRLALLAFVVSGCFARAPLSAAEPVPAREAPASVFDPQVARPFLPAFNALAAWAGTPAGLKLLDAGDPWLALLKAKAPADNLDALAPLARALAQTTADCAARLESIASLPAVEQRRLAKTLAQAAALASAQVREAAGPRGDNARVASAADAVRLSVAADGERFSPAYESPEPDEASMKQFIDEFHKDLIKERPDLFQLKMKKAKQSDFAFYRAFPQLFYKQLKERPQADALGKTKHILLSGDLHPENTELVPYKKDFALQPNDFDDAGKAPVALEIARMLGGAGVLGKTQAQRAALIAAAAEAYGSSLGLRFKEWAQGAANEKAVLKASTEDRDWAHNAGRALTDASLAKKLFEAAALDPKKWSVYDRAGAGLSSIGMRRYMFVNKEHGHAYELKELRPSALTFFTQGPQRDDPRAVAAAYNDLRKVPVDVRMLSFDGSDWYLRKRGPFQKSLALDQALSAARVIGGMAAQMHRRLADPADLQDALKAVTPRLVLDSLTYMSKMRQALLTLLKAGTWKAG